MESQSSTPNKPAGATIVVVDDDSLMRRLVGRTLKDTGYNVWTVEGAQSVTALFEKLGGAVDLLLTDVAMPDRAGSDLAADIRRRYPSTRIVYMSRYAPDELSAYGIDALGVFLLTKPFTPPQLLEMIQDVLGG